MGNRVYWKDEASYFMSYSDSFIKLFLEVLGLIQIDYSIISINKFG